MGIFAALLSMLFGHAIAQPTPARIATPAIVAPAQGQAQQSGFRLGGDGNSHFHLKGNGGHGGGFIS